MPLVESISTLENKLCEWLSLKFSLKCMYFLYESRTGFTLDFITERVWFSSWLLVDFPFFTIPVFNWKPWAAHNATLQAVLLPRYSLFFCSCGCEQNNWCDHFLPSKSDRQVPSRWGAQEPTDAVNRHNKGPQQSDHLCAGRGAISLQPGLTDETLDVL